MANVEAYPSNNLALMKGDDAAMLRCIHLKEEFSDLKKNMITYGKVLQKVIREISKICPDDSKEKYFIGTKEFRDEWYPPTINNKDKYLFFIPNLCLLQTL